MTVVGGLSRTATVELRLSLEVSVQRVSAVKMKVLCAIVLFLSVFGSSEMSEFTMNTGHKIPLIGLGTYLIRGSKTNEVINEALTAGYRLFDSAHLYNNEEDLGVAFKELLPQHNLTRSDIFITTKFLPSTEYKTEADYEGLVRKSLKNFQTDYIDLYLIHSSSVAGLAKDSPDVLTYRHAAWKALEKFQKEGLIRSIGVSNFMVKHLEDLKKASDVVPALNQVEWHPRNFIPELQEYCKKNNILLQAYSSLGSSANASLRKDPTVESIATSLGKSASQVLLRWANQRGVAIIPKASSKVHLEENYNLDFDIPERDMQTLDALKTTG